MRERIKEPKAYELLDMSQAEYRTASEKGRHARKIALVEPTDPKDQELVRELSAKFRRNQNALKDVSNLFEEMFLDLVQELPLLGEYGKARYSPYDDYKNGVDATIIMERKEGRSLLALGLDVTFGRADIEGKLSRIKKEIETDELATIKYPEVGMEPASDVPRSLVALKLETVSELVKLWSSGAPAEKIMSHPAIRMIFQQITEQLNVYSQYAGELGNYGSEADFYSRHEDFKGLMSRLPGSAGRAKDFTHETLLDKLKRFKEIGT